MAASTAPAFMNALHGALLALTLPVPAGGGSTTPGPLDGVRVNYGPALPDPGRESLNILGLAGDQAWASLGRLSKDEVYTVDVLVLVIREGQQTQAAVERAYAILEQLETLLRDSANAPTVAGTVRVASVSSVQLEVGASDTTRSALLTIGVRVEARI